MGGSDLFLSGREVKGSEIQNQTRAVIIQSGRGHSASIYPEALPPALLPEAEGKIGLVTLQRSCR